VAPLSEQEDIATVQGESKMSGNKCRLCDGDTGSYMGHQCIDCSMLLIRLEDTGLLAVFNEEQFTTNIFPTLCTSTITLKGVKNFRAKSQGCLVVEEESQ